jgi:O-antigen/teichoic acid export membrane protein
MARKDINTETRSIGSQAAHTASFVLVGKFSSIIFLGAAFIVVARLLGPAQYGIYVLALAVAGFTGAIGNLGVGTALNKFIPQHLYRNDKRSIEDILANSFFITIVTGLLLAAVTIALSGFVATDIFHNASYTLVIEIAAVSIISSMLFSASYSALLGFNRGDYAAIINTIQAVIQSLLSVLLVVLGFGPAGPIIGLIVGYGIAFLYSIRLIYGKHGLKMFVNPSLSSIRKIFSFSVPIAVSNAALGIASSLAFIVIGAYATTVVIGNIGVASKVNSLIDIVAGSISVSLLTMYSTTLASSTMRAKISKFYNHTVYYSLILLAPMLLFIVVLATPFSYVAFSGVYKLAPLFIAVMGIGALTGLAGQYANTLLTSANKVKEIFKYNVIITVVELAMIPVLIPLFKGIGLVLLLYLIAPVATNVLFIRKSAKIFKLRFNMGKLYRILAANAITMLLVVPLIFFWQSNYIPLLITAAIEVIIIYPIILGKLRGLDLRDIKIMRSMMGSVPIVSSIVSALLRYSTSFAS